MLGSEDQYKKIREIADSGEAINNPDTLRQALRVEAAMGGSQISGKNRTPEGGTKVAMPEAVKAQINRKNPNSGNEIE